MLDMMESEEFKEFFSKLISHLNDDFLLYERTGKFEEWKASHKVIRKVIKFPLVISRSPKVKLCVETAVADTETRHLKFKLREVLSEQNKT